MPERPSHVPVATSEIRVRLRPVHHLEATQALVDAGCCADVLEALVQPLRASSQPAERSADDFRGLQRQAFRFARALGLGRAARVRELQSGEVLLEWMPAQSGEPLGLSRPCSDDDEVLQMAVQVAEVGKQLSRLAAITDLRRRPQVQAKGRLIGYVRLCAGRPCNRLIADFLNAQLPGAEPCSEESVRLWARRHLDSDSVRWDLLWLLGHTHHGDSLQPPVLPAEQRDLFERRLRDHLNSRVGRAIERRRRKEEVFWIRQRRARREGSV